MRKSSSELWRASQDGIGNIRVMTDRAGRAGRLFSRPDRHRGGKTHRRNAARLPWLLRKTWYHPMRATEISMVELGIFFAAMIALVVCGCVATRAPKKTS